MRVVQLVRYGSIKGGAETYVASLSDGLRAQGHDVALVYAFDPDPSRPEVAAGIHLPGLVGSEDRDGLRAALDRLLPDVVHAHLPDEPWTLDVARGVAPTILAVHDHRLDCPVGTRYFAAWRRGCSVTPGLKCLAFNVIAHCGSLRANATLEPYRTWRRSFDAVRASDVSVQVFSEEVGDRLAPLLGRQPAVTPYPAPPPAPERAAAPAATSDLLLAPEIAAGSAARDRVEHDPRPVVLAIGRLNREKGFRELLMAITTLETPCHLVIVGEGHERPRLEKMASQTRGGHRITFKGWLDGSDRERWLERSVVVAMPSMWPEPFGIVGLEAMTAGRPVVAFEAGGIPTWLEHEANGLIVPYGDIRAFAAAIESLLEDRARAAALGEQGRRRAAEHFALDDHVQAVLALYREAGAA